ncbi:MAG: nitroreductase [Verrucomicrobiaceae bacterium]|nr:nitroreductase [Verrucomicrobiaceae bacterium]
MDALTLLNNRNSEPRLTKPAPDREILNRILLASLRAPDHGRLRPWRYLLIEGKARQKLGDLFADALLARKADASEDEVKKNRDAPLRAPLVIAVVAKLQDHPKVPRVEQLLTAGCAAYGILLAAQASGFGAIWRTGDNCYDEHVKTGLGLSADEQLIAYIYLGTPEGLTKPSPEVHLDEFVSAWGH